MTIWRNDSAARISVRYLDPSFVRYILPCSIPRPQTYIIYVTRVQYVDRNCVRYILMSSIPRPQTYSTQYFLFNAFYWVLSISTWIVRDVENCKFWANATNISLWLPRTRRKTNCGLTPIRVGSFRLSSIVCSLRVVHRVLSGHDRQCWLPLISRQNAGWSPTAGPHHYDVRELFAGSRDRFDVDTPGVDPKPRDILPGQCLL